MPSSASRVRIRRIAVAMLLPLVLLPVSSCSAGSPPDWIGVPTYEPTGTGGDAALATGTLTDADGCLVLVDSGETTLPLWPADAVTSTGRPDLKIYGKSYRLGQEIAVGGGGMQGYDKVLPESCDPYRDTMFIVSVEWRPDRGP